VFTTGCVELGTVSCGEACCCDEPICSPTVVLRCSEDVDVESVGGEGVLCERSG